MKKLLPLLIILAGCTSELYQDSASNKEVKVSKTILGKIKIENKTFQREDVEMLDLEINRVQEVDNEYKQSCSKPGYCVSCIGYGSIGNCKPRLSPSCPGRRISVARLTHITYKKVIKPKNSFNKYLSKEKVKTVVEILKRGPCN